MPGRCCHEKIYREKFRNKEEPAAHGHTWRYYASNTDPYNIQNMNYNNNNNVNNSRL